MKYKCEFGTIDKEHVELTMAEWVKRTLAYDTTHAYLSAGDLWLFCGNQGDGLILEVCGPGGTIWMWYMGYDGDEAAKLALVHALKVYFHLQKAWDTIDQTLPTKEEAAMFLFEDQS